MRMIPSSTRKPRARSRLSIGRPSHLAPSGPRLARGGDFAPLEPTASYGVAGEALSERYHPHPMNSLAVGAQCSTWILALFRATCGVMSEVTRILSALEQGDAKAAGALLPVVYEELRKLAASRLSKEPPGQTLQATALVHEA